MMNGGPALTDNQQALSRQRYVVESNNYNVHVHELADEVDPHVQLKR